MAALGADYSWARPGGAALRAAGVSGVGRYLATDGRGLTASEYQDLRNHGIGVWVCREGGATGMLGGRAQGVADAQLAQQQIAAIGLPANIPVFATADFDVQSSQFAVLDEYMRGFGSVLGGQRAGIYGGLHYMNHAHAAQVAFHFWQAGATSWDHGEAPQMSINFQQTTNTPPLPGTDHNYIYAMPAGGGATPLPTLAEDDEMKLIRDASNGTIAVVGAGRYFPFGGATNTSNASASAVAKIWGAYTDLTHEEFMENVRATGADMTKLGTPYPYPAVAPVVDFAPVLAAIKAIPAGSGAVSVDLTPVINAIKSLTLKAQ